MAAREGAPQKPRHTATVRGNAVRDVPFPRCRFLVCGDGGQCCWQCTCRHPPATRASHSAAPEALRAAFCSSVTMRLSWNTTLARISASANTLTAWSGTGSALHAPHPPISRHPHHAAVLSARRQGSDTARGAPHAGAIAAVSMCSNTAWGAPIVETFAAVAHTCSNPAGCAQLHTWAQQAACHGMCAYLPSSVALDAKTSRMVSA
jgi:hypothetical protein